MVAQEFSRAGRKGTVEGVFIFWMAELLDREKRKKEWNRPHTRINHSFFEQNSKIFSENCLRVLVSGVHFPTLF